MKKFKTGILLLFLTCLAGCSKSDDSNTPVENQLENVLWEVLYFEFTPDTGNNTFRLRYEIKFTNPNDVPVTGFYRITTNTDGLVTTALSTNLSPCYSIAANSECSVIFDEEDSFDVARVNSIELVSVEYNLEK